MLHGFSDIQTVTQNLNQKPTNPLKLFCCTQDLGWSLLYLGFPSASIVFALCGASRETAKHNQSSRTDSGCRRDLRRDDLENETQRKKKLPVLNISDMKKQRLCGDKKKKRDVKLNTEKPRIIYVPRNWRGYRKPSSLQADLSQVCGVFALFFLKLPNLDILNCRHRNKTSQFTWKYYLEKLCQK